MMYQRPRGLKTKNLTRVLLVVVLLYGATTIGLMGQGQPQPGASKGQSKSGQSPDKNKQDKKDESDDVVKLGGELVTVPFSVTDKRNAYITDLKQTDLRVLEDGKPQEIFSLVRETDLPITMALLIDTSFSQQLTIPDQRSAALKFFRSVMRPNKDVASIVTFEGDADLLQKPTGNQERLIAALDSIEVDLPAGASGGTPPINGDSRAGSTAMYDAVYATVDDQLAREAGRRVIILLTDGDDTSSRLKPREAIERAWRSEVQVYAIGIEGAMRDPGSGYVYYTKVDRGALRKLCEDTGGRAFFPERDEDLYRAFRQIEEDLRQQYILTYSPANQNADGSFRSIKVEVPTRKEVLVRHRRGYFAPKEAQTK